MPFTFAPPKAPSVILDIGCLAELLRSPEKAVEFLEQYKIAQAAYEAQRAANAVERAELDKKSQDILDASAQLVVEIDKLKQEQFKFDVVKMDALELANVKAREINKKSLLLDAKETDLNSYAEVLNNKEINLNKKEIDLNELQSNQSRKYNEQLNELKARENALIIRESKAAELKNLLKTIE